MNQNEFDVIVVGSGAGGMMAAIRAHDRGLSPLLVEKTGQYGGTTATSGGVLWIPANGQIDDDPQRALEYVLAASKDLSTPDKIRAYVDTAREMLGYLHQATPVRYVPCTEYPDYYQHLPGAAPGGRSMDPELWDGSLLGDELFRLREPTPGTTLMGKAMTTREAAVLARKKPGWMGVAVKTMARYYLDIPWRFKSRRDRHLTLGNALCGGLRYAMIQRKIPLWLDTPLESLVEEGGRITGIVVKRDGVMVTLKARKAVILASGGFERNQQMREQYLAQPTSTEWVGSPRDCNTGDGIRAGIAAGARTSLMHKQWGVPTIKSPNVPAGCQPAFVERGLGGFIAVNRQGKRFVNEALSYQEFVEAMYDDHAKNGGSVPAWFIFDANFRYNNPMGPFMPGMILPDSKLPGDWLGSIYWKSDTLSDLARQIGVDAKGLEETIVRFNGFARAGKDEDFGKGDSLFDRYFSVNDGKYPNSCLVPIEKGPYYAVRVDAGDTGTKGGLETNEHAQVLSQSGQTIPGLYAIGNCAAAVLGAGYPGAGSTIGPAMTFGYRAVNHLAQG
ncbi:MAG TPA: FAD-dependent oxidoreductase [Rhodocyclaceae bacterium]|nr:FAD-dependent oxidoreductase [Rhodocyclaceae bacterium]